jgi:hypothetical protein
MRIVHTWPAVLPAALLVGVGAAQVVLTRTAALSPWKGGGFGMFSTTDDAGRRQVRIFVTGDERSEELAIPASLVDLARRAAVLPGDRQLASLARGVVARERRHGRSVSAVRLECWRAEYDRATLTATSHRLREFAFRVDESDARP